MPPDAFTLPQLSKALGVRYRTLHSWVERGLLQASVQQSTGTGKPNLFNNQDALAACILTELRAAGVNFKLLEQAAEQLRERENELDQPAFVLVNGDVRIVFDSEQAGSALQRGGLTLAYNTAEALQRVDLLAPDAAAPVGAS